MLYLYIYILIYIYVSEWDEFFEANLESGRYYRLCIDSDGSTQPLLPGDTGVTVYMTPVASGEISMQHAAAVEIEVEACASPLIRTFTPYNIIYLYNNIIYIIIIM